jgi:hypothetical protein
MAVLPCDSEAAYESEEQDHYRRGAELLPASSSLPGAARM